MKEYESKAERNPNKVCFQFRRESRLLENTQRKERFEVLS